MKMKFPQAVTVHIDSTGCHHQCPEDGLIEVSDPNLEKEFLHAGFTPVEEAVEAEVEEEETKASEDSEGSKVEGEAKSDAEDQK